MQALQARRHGGHSVAVLPQMTACAPQTKFVPPKRALFPKKIIRIGATGMQIDVQLGVWHPYFCNFCGLTPDFIKFLG